MGLEQPKVFISYNRTDRDWAEWIAGAIERSGYQPIIQAWDFRPGQNFVLRMDEAMAGSDLTIAVLSEDYLNAEFTRSEWAAAFAKDPTGKNRKLIPVRVAKCHLPPILSEIIYIDLVGRAEQDAKRALLDGLKPSGKPAQPPQFPDTRAESPSSTAPFPPSLARLHGVPDLPPHYLPREEVLARLKQKLLAGSANVGITGQSLAVGVQGMGGIGKTVLATALARDSEMRQAFPNGLYWLTIGQKPNLLELQNQLLRQLTGSKETLTTEQEAKDALREAFEGRQALLVVDDVWALDHAYAFAVTAPPARLLITTRNSETVVGLGAEEHRLGMLPLEDALAVLAGWADVPSRDQLPTQAAEIAKECGFLPLALSMTGAMIRRSNLPPAVAWQDALDCLRAADLEEIKRAFPGYPYPDLLRAIEVSVEALSDHDRERYLDLAVFPDGQFIPETPLRALWKLDARRTRTCMARLAERSLATIVAEGQPGGNNPALNLHDLQHDFIRKRREKELPELHLRLTEAWNALLELDSYAWRWVPYHLLQAGRKGDLRRLLLNYNYLAAKLAATDINALIADYDYLPEDKDLQTVQSVLRHSAHILAGSIRELPSQLLGRLPVGLTPDVDALLCQASEHKGFPWLRPFGPSITALSASVVRTLYGHTSHVTAVAVAPDGRHLVSGSDDNTLRVWDLATGETKLTLKGHTDSVSAVAVTPDGRHVVSGSDDNTLRVWDFATGETKLTLKGHTDSVSAVAVTPDGRHVVSGSDDDTLRIWDLATGKIKKRLKGHSDSVLGVAVTPDGRYVVSGSRDDDDTLRIWDLATGKTKKRLLGHTCAVSAVAITPDGRHAVSGSWDNTLRVWDLATGESKTTLQGHINAIYAVAITPDGRHVVSGSWDNTLRIWDLAAGETKATFQGHTNGVSAVAVTPGGHHVVSGSWDNTLRIWDLEREESETTLQGHTEAVSAVAITGNGRHVVSGSWDGTLRVWDPGTGRAKATLQGHTDAVLAAAVTSDGRNVVSGSLDNTLRVWDLERWESETTLQGHTEGVSAVAITPDGRHAVSGSWDTTLRVWDLDTRKTKMTLKGHTGRVNALVVTRDGRHAVSTSEYEKTLRVWDLETGKTRAVLHGHTDATIAVAFTPDGRQVVSGSRDKTLRIWDLETRKTKMTLKGHTDSVTAVEVTSDGRHVVSGSDDSTLRVWDLQTGKIKEWLKGHSDSVRSMTVTPDGRYVVSGSRDNTLRVWDLKDAKDKLTFTLDAIVTACVPAQDNRTIIAGDSFGRVHFLRIVEADPRKSSISDTKIVLLRRK